MASYFSWICSSSDQQWCCEVTSTESLTYRPVLEFKSHHPKKTQAKGGGDPAGHHVKIQKNSVPAFLWWRPLTEVETSRCLLSWLCNMEKSSKNMYICVMVSHKKSHSHTIKSKLFRYIRKAVRKCFDCIYRNKCLRIKSHKNKRHCVPKGTFYDGPVPSCAWNRLQ